MIDFKKLKEEIIKVYKQVFCRHDYDMKYVCMLNGGMRKLYKCTCKKCGKVKSKIY